MADMGKLLSLLIIVVNIGYTFAQVTATPAQPPPVTGLNNFRLMTYTQIRWTLPTGFTIDTVNVSLYIGSVRITSAALAGTATSWNTPTLRKGIPYTFKVYLEANTVQSVVSTLQFSFYSFGWRTGYSIPGPCTGSLSACGGCSRQNQTYEIVMILVFDAVWYNLMLADALLDPSCPSPCSPYGTPGQAIKTDALVPCGTRICQRGVDSPTVTFWKNGRRVQMDRKCCLHYNLLDPAIKTPTRKRSCYRPKALGWDSLHPPQ